MSITHFSGPVMTGLQKDATGNTADPTNIGPVVSQQSVNLTQNSTTAVSGTINVPAGSRIIDIIVDVLTAFNSATTAVLSVGTAAAGTQYASGVDAKTAGRVRPTFTAAQLAAMSNQTVLGVAAAVAGPVVVTITPTGATSAGYVTATVIYAQQPTSDEV